jgi:hypothetical protein
VPRVDVVVAAVAAAVVVVLLINTDTELVSVTQRLLKHIYDNTCMLLLKQIL